MKMEVLKNKVTIVIFLIRITQWGEALKQLAILWWEEVIVRVCLSSNSRRRKTKQLINRLIWADSSYYKLMVNLPQISIMLIIILWLIRVYTS